MYPHIWIHSGRVLVQFEDKGSVFMLAPDGLSCEQLRIPPDAWRLYWTRPDRLIAQLPDNRRSDDARTERAR
jgi:hypothetical protein